MVPWHAENDSVGCCVTIIAKQRRTRRLRSQLIGSAWADYARTLLKSAEQRIITSCSNAVWAAIEYLYTTTPFNLRSNNWTHEMEFLPWTPLSFLSHNHMPCSMVVPHSGHLPEIFFRIS